MYRQTATAFLISSALLTGVAFAQTSDPTIAPSPATSAGSKFTTEQGLSEFRASKFIGLDVYGSDGEKIGDISEILIDGKGAAKAAVIGVGGFLGIGQKSVAVPFTSLEWSFTKPVARAGATTGSTTPPAPMGATPPTVPASPTRSPEEQAAFNGYPDHAKVILTKAELQDAPAFRYFAETRPTTVGGSNATPAAGVTSPTPPAVRQ